MKIYDKKLSNLRQLKRERELLKKRLNGGEAKVETSKAKIEEEKEESFVGGLLSGITSGSVLTSALNVAPTVFDIIRNKSFSRSGVKQQVKTKTDKKSFITAALTDFVTGYIKWKILELSYKGVKAALKSNKGKKMREDAVASFKKIYKPKS